VGPGGPSLHELRAPARTARSSARAALLGERNDGRAVRLAEPLLLGRTRLDERASLSPNFPG
jgi:hypothetical protein